MTILGYSNIKKIIDSSKATLDLNGIWVCSSMDNISEDVLNSKKSWEEIYDLDLIAIKEQTRVFNRDKLSDHLSFFLQGESVNRDSIFLEIGCGPAYIGQYLAKKYNLYFVGVDFNYKVLVTLKSLFDEIGYKKYILIYGDISDMPLKDNSIDLIYGGGVIEHSKSTKTIIDELHRVLKVGGISFNTVPALSMFWLTRFFYSIPNIRLLRNVFEYIHITLLKYTVLNKHFGYELSFPLKVLKDAHKDSGFLIVNSGAYAFHANSDILKWEFLQKLYYWTTSVIYSAPFYFIKAKKSSAKSLTP